MKAAMYAIIKKDFRIIASNRRLFPALFIVPLVLTIVLPSIFVITIHFVPDDPDITKLLSLLPETARMESLELTLSGMILNYILPIFFLIIPIMTASIMAASAFVGEKERHTLETLLYCPLTLKQIFQAKVWASFLLSMLVSVISFAAMFLVIETELFFLAGRLLILGDGSTLNRQKGGFASAKEAMKYRDNLIVKLTQNQYMPYRFTLKEFYNYWLYYYIIDGCKYAYNTFKYYATPVKRFCEYFRPDTYMDSITTTDLKNFINKCETFSAYKAMMQMIQNSFQYAKNQQIIISNPAPLAIEICKKEKKITKPPTKKNAFTLNELMNLLLTARKMDYTFYLFLLLSASTGARVSETRAICFSKIDFQKKQLLIDCQLGRGYDNEGFDDNTLLSQKRTLKTRNSKRYVPLPDFIMDELYLARARYEETLKNDPEFDENLDFVLFRDHGKAIARPYYYFKKLMKKCNIDCTKHVWHDLRHTYATLLDQNNMNMKVVSEILGHYSEEFTNEVYVIHKPEVIIYDTSEVMNSFIESLKLDSTERTIPVYDISFIQEYLF